MKNLILCLSLLFISGMALAQTEVPNGDFEEWGLFNTWTLSPAEWLTPNGQLMAPVEIDSNAYEGNFAMRVTPFLGFETAAANASTSFAVNTLPEEFSFQVKSFIEEGAEDSVRVSVRYYESDAAQAPLYSISWIATSSIDDWTQVSLQLDTEVLGVSMITIDVQCGYNGALGGGLWNTWISVDDMKVGESTGVHGDDSCLNPFDLKLIGGQITTQGCGVAGQDMTMEIYDLSGKLLTKNRGSSIEIDAFSEGLYLVRAYSDGVPVVTEKFVLR